MIVLWPWDGIRIQIPSCSTATFCLSWFSTKGRVLTMLTVIYSRTDSFFCTGNRMILLLLPCSAELIDILKFRFPKCSLSFSIIHDERWNFMLALSFIIVHGHTKFLKRLNHLTPRPEDSSP